jgi:hypothetical protein
MLLSRVGVGVGVGAQIAKLTFLRDKARIEESVAHVKQLFSAKIYGHLLRTGEGTQSLCVYSVCVFLRLL